MARCDHAVRAAAFHAWDRASLSELVTAARLGTGRYGTVVECAPGWPGCAAKIVLAKTWRARRQAYREHVVGLLQSLLLLERVTPHFPWHYGAELRATAPPASQLSIVLFMERYPTSLPDGAASLLTTAAAWGTLLFQLAQAAVALALIFGVVQNDAYPRNALVRPCACTTVVYDVAGTRYALRAPFLAVLTDYGISSGDLVVAPSVPEVAFGQAATVRVAACNLPRVRGRFAFVQPQAHVLSYRDLPVYARDLSMLLKWPSTAEQLPRAPLAVHLWSQAALHRLDGMAAALEVPAGLLLAFHAAFAPPLLASYRLDFARAPPASVPTDFALRLTLRDELLEKAERALRQAQVEEATWATAAAPDRERQTTHVSVEAPATPQGPSVAPPDAPGAALLRRPAGHAST